MIKELALYIWFQAKDEFLDSFLEMLEANSLQFCGGGNGKIIFAYEDEDEEVPPAIEGLIKWLMGDDEDDNTDIVGYIRNRSRGAVTETQRELINKWLGKSVERFEIYGLVDVYEKKRPQA